MLLRSLQDAMRNGILQWTAEEAFSILPDHALEHMAATSSATALTQSQWQAPLRAVQPS